MLLEMYNMYLSILTLEQDPFNYQRLDTSWVTHYKNQFNKYTCLDGIKCYCTLGLICWNKKIGADWVVCHTVNNVVQEVACSFPPKRQVLTDWQALSRWPRCRSKAHLWGRYRAIVRSCHLYLVCLCLVCTPALDQTASGQKPEKN